MNDQTKQQRLDDLLDALVASTDERGAPAIEEWVRHYPEFEQELTEFAVSWSLMSSLPAADVASIDKEVFVRRGMETVRRLPQYREVQAARQAPISDLATEARKQKLSPRQLANATDLSTVLLRKLDRRLVRAGSIPQEVVERLAAALHRDVSSIATYLQQGPTLANSASYRSEKAPELGEPEDFADAVRRDETLSPEQRGYWLGVARGTNG